MVVPSKPKVIAQSTRNSKGENKLVETNKHTFQSERGDLQGQSSELSIVNLDNEASQTESDLPAMDDEFDRTKSV